MVSKKTIVKIGVVLVAIAAIIAIVLAVILSMKNARIDEEERKAHELLNLFRSLEDGYSNKFTKASWDYESNMNEQTMARLKNLPLERQMEAERILDELEELDWMNFRDKDLMFGVEYHIYAKRELPEIQIKYQALEDVTNKMTAIYAKTKICDYKNKTKCDLNLEPDIVEIFQKSRDPEELKHTWVEWHNKVGRNAKHLYLEYIQKRNETSNRNGLNSTDEWFYDYHEPDIEQQLLQMWLEMKPLYLELHAYVRKQLYNEFGKGLVDRKGPIPTHLLGNMWGQTWNNLIPDARPYLYKPDMSITPVMLKKNYTAIKIFQMADEFFQSINLTAVPPSFWQNSILTRPDDGRDMVCHASAWDFGDGEDFRIKQCTIVNEENFEIAHHEMGHIQYYMQYKHLDNEDKYGGNPGFHEAIGDLIALSAMSPKHLRKVGLLEDDGYDYESMINDLFNKATFKVANLPFEYLLDIYRIDLFNGKVAPEDYNCYFWKIKEAIQGVEPPVKRTEEDFDAVAKYHVAANADYNKYFASNILQFQFHKALCTIAGEYEMGNDKKPMSNCDIYQSAEAGNALGDMLKIGSSIPWQDILEKLTGERSMNASSLLEYFKPLHAWLYYENRRTGEYIGWEKSKIEFCTEEQEKVMQKMNEPWMVDDSSWFDIYHGLNKEVYDI